MHLQKLIDVLKHFDEERLRHLDEYVRSPYFKTPPVCALLLNRLMPLHPRFLQKKMEWQKIGKRDKTLNTIAKQRNAATGLLKAIDGFIGLEQWQKSKAEVTRHQLKGYYELQLTDKFEEGFKSQMLYIENVPEQDIDAFFEKHMLVEMSMQSFSAKTDRTISNDIMPVVKTLDEYYALKKLRYLCEALNRQQVLGVNYNAENIPSLLKILKPYNTPQFPYVYLFVNVFRMMNENTFEESFVYYSMLKQFMEKRSDVVVPQSVKEAADYVLSNCILWHGKGHKQASDEYLWWIGWKMKNNLLLNEGKLLPVTFRNIVSIAQSRDNLDFIGGMINEFAQFLPAEHYESNLAYANGLYCYSQKSYKKAARYFLSAEAKEDIVFNCIIRYWHWRSLYEEDMNDIDSLYNHLLTFDKHLHRNSKQLKIRAKTFEIFISYAMNLLKTEDRGLIAENLTKLKKQDKFVGKDWLINHYSLKGIKKARALDAQAKNIR